MPHRTWDTGRKTATGDRHEGNTLGPEQKDATKPYIWLTNGDKRAPKVKGAPKVHMKNCNCFKKIPRPVDSQPHSQAPSRSEYLHSTLPNRCEGRGT